MEFVTKKTSRFLVNSALDKETLSKKGEIGQAFHRERSTVWLDKKFTLSTRKTSQNNYSKVDITIFFFFSKIIVKLLTVNLHRLQTVCCEVKLLQKTALNKHIFQTQLLLLFSKIGQKIKPPFSKKKCNL